MSKISMHFGWQLRVRYRIPVSGNEGAAEAPFDTGIDVKGMKTNENESDRILIELTLKPLCDSEYFLSFYRHCSRLFRADANAAEGLLLR